VRAAENKGVMVGVGAALTLIVLLVLQSLTGTGLFGTKIVTTTIPSLNQATDAVSGRFYQHMLSLDSRNVSEVVSEYEANATITWTSEQVCQCNALDGNFTGVANMTRLMEELLYGINNSYSFGTTSFAAQNITQVIEATSDKSVVVNSTFGFFEQSIAFGKINATVSAEDLFSYSPASQTWLISHETWDYLSFHEQPPVINGY
jgi:hypothetical protein